ncbi:MAG: hypothetical protein ABH864_06415 [archaeon]
MASDASMAEAQRMVARYVVKHKTELEAQYGKDYIAIDVNGTVHGHGRSHEGLNSTMARRDANVLIARVDDFKIMYEHQEHQDEQ